MRQSATRGLSNQHLALSKLAGKLRSCWDSSRKRKQGKKWPELLAKRRLLGAHHFHLWHTNGGEFAKCVVGRSGVDGEHVVHAPVAVRTRNHDMETPLTTFFLRFNKAEFLQRLHVSFHPLDLGFAHAAALKIYGKSGKVRRCGLA